MFERYSPKILPTLYYINGDGPFVQCDGKPDFLTGRCSQCGALCASSAGICYTMQRARQKEEGT